MGDLGIKRDEGVGDLGRWGVGDLGIVRVGVWGDLGRWGTWV